MRSLQSVLDGGEVRDIAFHDRKKNKFYARSGSQRRKRGSIVTKPLLFYIHCSARASQASPCISFSSCINPHTSGERVAMSTSSDGHKAGRVEDPLVLSKALSYSHTRTHTHAHTTALVHLEQKAIETVQQLITHLCLLVSLFLSCFACALSPFS